MDSEQDIIGTDDVQRLLSQGKQKGCVTYGEISDVLGNHTILGVGQIDDVLQFLDDEGVQVVNSADELHGSSYTDGVPSTVDEAMLGADGGYHEEESAVLEGMPMDDSMRMWLREIGRTHLLSLVEEIRLAKRIERG